MQFTKEHQKKLEDYLKDRKIPSGLVWGGEACSVAAINIAINGKLTNDIPDCMSVVLGKAVITLQDAMPSEIRNSDAYKAILPDMAGTGREHERERLSILRDWMWGVVLPQIQSIADRHGFGKEWHLMCQDRNAKAARVATAAAVAKAEAAADITPYAEATARAAEAAAVAKAVDAAASKVVDAAMAAEAEEAADAAAMAAEAKIWASRPVKGAKEKFWKDVDPIGLLTKMTRV